MGKDYGPTWATLAVGYLEETKLYPQTRRLYPAAVAEKFEEDYKRFQDDTLIINEYGTDKETILQLFNDLHPQLEFTSESSHEKLLFLDIMVMLTSQTSSLKFTTRKTDSFNYLHFGGNHPCHTKRNISYSLARRVKSNQIIK